jgi:ElaB/YqjD/DUF883 family membrane-anchored ribosome-binding protein
MAQRPTGASARPESEAADTAQLAKDIAALRADLEQITALLTKVANARSESILEGLQHGAADLGANAEALLKEKTASVEAALDDVTDYARRKPLHAMAWAAGAGMLFGLLFGRR